ncbi:MAG: hypothetical protein IPK79_02515 [Vampirovibrionales bacterium]|nr:hypothetical protein [Vampirovibrionales bacterium]
MRARFWSQPSWGLRALRGPIIPIAAMAAIAALMPLLWLSAPVRQAHGGLWGALPVDSRAVAATPAAFGFSPQRYESALTYGMGVYFAPPRLTLYAAPSDDAPPIDVIRWTPDSRSLQAFSEARNQPVAASAMFLCYYPQLRLAAMATLSENGDGWAEVVADQRTGKTAWVKLRERLTEEAERDAWPRHLGQLQTWLDFVRYNGVASGVYWLNGVSPYDRSPRMRPEDGAKLLPIQVVRKLNVKFARGNWLLVEVMDFDRTTPIGWVRWRDESGRLMAFPNFSGQSSSVLLGGF